MARSKPCYLLPWVFKYLSLIFLILGAVLYYFRYIRDIKFSFLDWTVFAINSQYFETKSWTFIKNNMSEEIIGIFLLVGFYFLAFSREKIETAETNAIRLESMMLTIFINTIALILSFLLIYGITFFWIMIVDAYALFIIYYIIFRIKYAKMKSA
ncbi:MAG: hypothetical protein ABFD61_05365 [Chloroherpetonaceae bacterium]